MNQSKLLLVAALAASAFLSAAPAAPVDAYNVVWDSPSTNHHGSMPLGNGDITLNTWMTKNGDLEFYIGKTDAWDDNARLLKVGKVRVHFEPNPVAAGKAFRQELKLDEGCMEITTSDAIPSGRSPIANRQSKIQLWVDANNPVIHVTAGQRHADGGHSLYRALADKSGRAS